MTKQVILTVGLSYAYGKLKFKNNIAQKVDDETAKYLESTGQFSVMGVKGPKVKKVRIKKPDNAAAEDSSKTEPNGGEANKEDTGSIPIFRSKKELAKYADKEHGLEFSGVLKDMKMEDMRVDLVSHIKANKEKDTDGIKIEV